MLYWCQDSRNSLQRLEKWKPEKCSVSAISFSPDARLLFYAIGYDWSKGADFYDLNKQNPAFKSRIYCHINTDAEVTPKPAKI